MISICIPVFNWNISGLVTELFRQAELLSVPYEMIIIDDHSTIDYQLMNRQVQGKAQYIQLTQNIGRSAIRNLFLKYTRYDNLLFLDCDVIIISENFLRDYYVFLSDPQPTVICGGRIYEKLPSERTRNLRWKYGKKKEAQLFSMRQASPHKSFMTNNFLIARKILLSIPFDTRLTGYGHEDTLFGYMLKQNSIPVHHINNPVLSDGLENNDVYLYKTEQGIVNLIKILQITDHNKDLVNEVSVLRFYYSLKKLHLDPLFRVIFVVTKPSLKFFLSKLYPSLWLFDFYKLGILLTNVGEADRRS